MNSKNIQNLEKVFPEKLAQTWLKKSISFLRLKEVISAEHQVLISVVNVSEKKIKNLNKNYRNKNEMTDILSFGYNFDDKKIEGDLILCWEVIKKNAQEDGIEAEEELAKNLIHGCLHLTGLEHSEKMFGLQSDFLKDFFE